MQLDDERIAANLRRGRIALPFVAALHVTLLAVFVAFRPTSAGEQGWRHGLIAIHGTGVVLVGLLWVAARTTGWRAALEPVRRNLGEVLMTYALALGTVVVLNSMQHRFTITAWLVSVVAGSIVLHARLVPTIVAHTVSLAVVLVACVTAGATSADRAGLSANAVGAGLLGFVLSRVLYASFAREVAARRLVEAANQQLEERVAAQVGEIVASVGRIEALNRQLAAQVKSRSDELSAALQRLAAVQHGGDVLGAGAVIGDRFEIQQLLGVGGMGVVYAAHDRVADASVALKLVHGNVGGVEPAYRFLQEASATASLHHPAIVRVLHVDLTADGRLYQVLELIDGRTLDTRAGVGRGIEPRMVARLGAVLADALAAAHAEGIVHRDVKPQNVMLTRTAPGCCLLDFGLAKLRRSLVGGGLTEAGIVLGTPEFIAPEQISDPASVSTPADVYALGVVLYLCAAGRLPFDAATSIEWLHAHVHTAPAPLDPPDAPALGALVAACLAKDPAARPTARALSDQLAALADRLGAPPLEAWNQDVDQPATRRLGLTAPLP